MIASFRKEHGIKGDMNQSHREGGSSGSTLISTEKDPLWYKKAIIYELHVRSFFDSNADGIGDFRGLTQKLDYLQDLGVTAIWLLPFYPSPLRDDGYDIADYYPSIRSTARWMISKTFLNEAHARGLRVITELVINHTSDQHPWFQRARRAQPGSQDATTTSGATTRRNTRKRGSSSRISNLRIGPGIRSPTPIIGIASIFISPT